MATEHLHPIVRTWFERRFGVPTDAQRDGWLAIAGGRHTLIAAPTGSGKTLAAFLNALDALVRLGLEGGGLPDATQVVYVSPLRALSYDIKRNLEEPLAEMQALAEELGTPLPGIRVAVRTGDTPAHERTLHVRRPPHILITTPESLFILITSERARQGLRSVHTLILDELHALVGNKRGSHLALTVERLCYLAQGPVTRIGLSATQEPVSEVAHFLVGSDTAGCAIVDLGHRREMDLRLEIPEGEELGAIATHELWAKVLDEIAAHARVHRTTLVFVNTRKMVERVAHLLSERLGTANVGAHHGSLSRETRLDTERRLKEGALEVCVATASLELGIDIGDIDLVCLVGSPRNIGVVLQRVGRSGHSAQGKPKGFLYPLTRDELVEMAALLRAIRRGLLDALVVPPWPLDVLAQQVVGACASDEWAEDELFDLCQRAYPYWGLPREQFDEVIALLADGVATRWGRGSAYLHRDRVHGRLRARRGARLAAVTSGGAIPDTGDYAVIADPEGTLVGTVHEDFAVESMAGDIFLLGNVPWRISRVEGNTVRVTEAVGQSPTIPFWLGEAAGRTCELSREVSIIRAAVDERMPAPDAAVAWVMEEAGVMHRVAGQIVDYVAEGKRVLGVVPTAERLVAERFFDDAGGMQLVIHAPLGSRINRAWGLALRKRFCRMFDFELQATATDEGINLSLGPQHSFPVEETFRYVKSSNARDVLLQAVLQSPIFGARWRWVITRSLALLRFSGGRKVPVALQRMRSDDLLAAVFPQQAACLDNLPAGEDVELPDHPLVFETVRDCLTEALDVEGMTETLRRIEWGAIEVYGRDTVQPSVFAHQLLNAMPYAFLDNAPLEERRARMVALRRALPEDAARLGALDPQVIRREEINAWPTIRDPEELHDALLTLGVLTDNDLLVHESAAAEWRTWLRSLMADGRACQLKLPQHRIFWAAAERRALIQAAYPNAQVEPIPDRVWPCEDATDTTSDDATAELLRSRAEVGGPFTLNEMSTLLALSPGSVRSAVARLEAEGVVLRGRFRLDVAQDEFCDRRILARIHRSTIGLLRKEIRPVPSVSLIRFLLEWQHVTPATRLAGVEGLLEVVEQLQGYEAAVSSWEEAILPARIEGYRPAMLDALCFSGDVAWGRFARRSPRWAPAGLTRNGPISLAIREDVPWLLDPPDSEGQAPVLFGAALEVAAFLRANGASFQSEIVAAVRRLPAEVEEALWQLVAMGLATADGFDPLRRLGSWHAGRLQRKGPYRRRDRPRQGSSRWSLWRRAEPSPDATEARVGQLLRRYGVLVPELLVREPLAPPRRLLARALRRAEARGEVRGGRFVAGFAGEQFALPEAVEALREVDRRGPSGEVVRLSAADPLNLVGLGTTGTRVPAVPGGEVCYLDGVPVESPLVASTAIRRSESVSRLGA